MPTKADIGLKQPEMGQYLYKRVEELRRNFYNQNGKNLSDAAVARQVGMIPETFRGYKAGEGGNVTLETAIDLVRLMGPEVTKFMDFSEAKDDNGQRMDADSLIIAAYAPQLTSPQRSFLKLQAEYFQEHPQASEQDFLDHYDSTQKNPGSAA